MIVLAISCLVGGMMTGMSLNAYAQASNIIRLDDQNHYGQLSIDNVHVSEKEYYKLVIMDVHVKVKDLALEDFANVYWGSITLTNENGKKYQPEGNVDANCNKKQFDGTFYTIPGVKGSEGGIGQQSLCYMVEKEFNNFKVYYTIPYYNTNNPDNPYTSFQIGNIDLTNTDGQVTAPSSPSDSSSSPNPSISTTSQSTANIFEQLMNFFKQIFHFMILGSTLLNDSQR